MGLIVKVFQLIGGALLRFALIVMVLFAVHLALSRLIPQVRETQKLLEQGPQIERQLERAKEDLRAGEQHVRMLQQRLEARSRAELETVRREVEQHEHYLAELERRKLRAERELAEARGLVSEYCDTYNPLKLWFCRDMRERSRELDEQVEKTLGQLQQEVRANQQRLDELETQLRRVADDPKAQLELLKKRDPKRAAELTSAVEEALRKVQVTRQSLSDLQARRAEVAKARASAAGWLLREWRRVWIDLLSVALVALCLPVLNRVLWYFVVMPLCTRASPIVLSEARGARLVTHPAERSLRVALGNGEELFVRSGYARPVEGRARSKLLYRYSAPFVSYAAGLVLLTRLRATRADESTSATLAAPDDPDSYLMRIDLDEHPGIVIHPRQLVAVIGDLELDTIYRPWNFHAWSTWQIRYIVLGGTGSVIVEGTGDVVAEHLTDSQARIEQKLVIGFDTQLAYRTRRTETFLPYLVGKAPLVDDQFEGTGTYLWQKSSSAKSTTVVERTFDALFGAIGKLLGF